MLQQIFSLKKLDSPNGERLQTISNVTLEVSRQLTALGYPAEHCDLLFIHLVQAKLNEKTSVQWDLKRRSDRPTLIDFTRFLDRQAKALNNAYCQETAQKSRDQNDRKRPFEYRHKGNGSNNGSGNGYRNEKGNSKGYHGESKRFKPSTSQSNNASFKKEKSDCAMCQEDHLTRKCPKFLQLNLSKRKELVRTQNLCYNCLGYNHASRDCKSGKCNRCDKKHNSLLCTENPNNRQLNVSQVASKRGKQYGRNKRNKPKQQ